MAFFDDLAEPYTGEALFDQMADTVFFIKDRHGRYVCINETLVSRCAATSKRELLGQTPSTVFGHGLGNDYELQDRQVIESGKGLLDKLELHVYQPRRLGWCLTCKLPLMGKDGHVAGLVGISRDLKIPDMASSEFNQIAEAIAYAERELALPPTVTEMAKIAAMSTYQLDRRMKRLFGLSTGQWLLKQRIDRASRRLLDTNQSIVDIAMDAGYRDHSAFARQFRRTTGTTPSDFRAFGGGSPD